MFSQTEKNKYEPVPKVQLKKNHLDTTGLGIWIGWVYLLKMQGLGKKKNWPK
jgi:hypothetical protein